MTASTKASKLPKLTPLEALEQAAECLKTLAHPHRLRMIQMLLRGRYMVGELAEEPGLVERFSGDYLAYQRNVPRWIPRVTAWDGVESAAPEEKPTKTD